MLSILPLFSPLEPQALTEVCFMLSFIPPQSDCKGTCVPGLEACHEGPLGEEEGGVGQELDRELLQVLQGAGRHELSIGTLI